MAAIRVDVSTTPTALANVDESQRYSVQNQSVNYNFEIYIVVSDTAPDLDADPPTASFIIPPLGFGYPTPESGDSIWVWVKAGRGMLVYDRAD